MDDQIDITSYKVWAALVGDSSASRKEWAAVVEGWSETHRRYHNLTHLAAVLNIVNGFTDAATDPAAVALAAWYHDVVYDPLRDDNEQRSAERADAGLRGLTIPSATVEEVVRLVLLTTSHDPAPEDANGMVLCDADLAVLAGSSEAYTAYASAIRDEYKHYSDAEFTKGRIAVLEHLLSLPALYRLPSIAEDWTARAQANMNAEVSQLRARLT
ncbi:hypothetical protein BDV95DRAFT_176583 [Massariosphaeria phaeospora]|uniref:HD domain-containing protein n=1 Tax=Massariosphaeria phaeospora TaxID=100035 RepID=A0A7C8I9K5_9PLEO|nr:hypothetical protein BDV95DRAFT_176583 [Massariosphaeria phaeospora]